MAKSQTTTNAEVVLEVELKKANLNKVISTLKYLEGFNLQIKPDTIKEFKRDISAAITAGAKGSNLNAIFDKKGKESLDKFANARMKAITEFASKGDATKAETEAFQKLMNDQEDAASKQFAELAAMANQHGGAAKQLKEALSPKGLGETGHSIVTGIVGGLDNLKAGDIAGFTRLIGGGVAKEIGRRSQAKAGAAANAGSVEEAAAMSEAAAGLAETAAAFAVVAGVVAGLVALLVAADGQAKEFNTTLLEGAGAADFAFSGIGDSAANMDKTLSNATDAAENMATKWRGQTKDYLAMTAALNDAGITYDRMGKSAIASSGEMEKWMTTTLVYSKAFGVSASEMAENMGDLAQQQGKGNDQIRDSYDAVLTASRGASMGQKRFFSSVSQATAGMALYNVRMGEAAELLKVTSKVLSGTDATEFIKSLTTGMGDESYLDRIKTTVIKGFPLIHKAMVQSAADSAVQFTEGFADHINVKKAFKDANIDLDIVKDPDKLAAMLGGKSDKQIRALIHALQDSGEDGAAKQLQGFAEAAKASQAQGTEVTKGFNQLSMGSQLAIKAQSYNGQLLSDMTAEQLAGFEQYSGVSGKQLEMLKLVQNSARGNLEAAQGAQADAKKAGLTADSIAEANLKLTESGLALDKQGNIVNAANGKAIDSVSDVLMQSGAMQKELTDIAGAKSDADKYAETTMQNTHSMLDVLQGNIAKIMTDIYNVVLAFYDDYTGLDEAEKQNKALALKQNEAVQSVLKKQLDVLTGTEGKTPEKIAADAKTAETVQTQLDATQAMHANIAGQGRSHLDSLGILDITPDDFANRAADATGNVSLADTNSPLFDMMSQGDDAATIDTKTLKLDKKADTRGQKELKLQDEELDLWKTKMQPMMTSSFEDALKRQDAAQFVASLGIMGDAATKDISDLLSGSPMDPDFMAALANQGTAATKNFTSEFNPTLAGTQTAFTTSGGKPGGNNIVPLPAGGMGATGAPPAVGNVTINVNGSPAEMYGATKSALKITGITS